MSRNNIIAEISEKKICNKVRETTATKNDCQKKTVCDNKQTGRNKQQQQQKLMGSNGRGRKILKRRKQMGKTDFNTFRRNFQFRR